MDDEVPQRPRLARVSLRALLDVGSGPDEGEAPTGETRADAYLIVRGEPRAAATRVRRVVRTPTSRRPGDQRPARPARIIAHAPGFRRAVAEMEARAAEHGGPLSEPTPSASPGGPETRRFAARATRIALAGVLLGGLGAASAWFMASRSPAASALEVAAEGAAEDSNPAPEPSTPAVASRPIRTAGAPAPSVAFAAIAEPDALASELRGEILAVEVLPSGGAIAVTGSLTNPGPRAVTAVQFEVRLLAGGTPVRRRDVFCCDDLPGESLGQIAQEAGHPHFSPTREVTALQTLEPDESRAFTALFVGVDPATLRGPLTAEVRALTARGATDDAFREL